MGVENWRVHVRPIDLRLGRGAGQSFVPDCWVVTVELTRRGSETTVGVVDCAGTEDVDEDMNGGFTKDPERALQTTLCVCFREASHLPASLNYALRLTAAVRLTNQLEPDAMLSRSGRHYSEWKNSQHRSK